MTLMQLLLASGGKTLTYITTSSSSTTTISYPSGIEAGDVGLLFQGGINSSNVESPVAPAVVTPSGWNNRYSASVSFGNGLDEFYSGTVAASSRIMTGSESGNLSGLNGTYNLKRMVIIRPNWVVTSISDFSNSIAGSQDNLPAASVNSGNGPALSCAWLLSSGNNTLSYSGPNTEILFGSGTSPRVTGITIFNQGAFASSSWNPADGGLFNLLGVTGITVT